MDYRNQRLLLSEDAQNYKVLIVGTGAIGSAVALALAKMGYTNIECWDGDKIEEHNFANQMFPISALGKNKAEATAEMCEAFSGVKVTAIPLMFDGKFNDACPDIVIMAVDSMKVRKEMWNKFKENRSSAYYIDARMGGQFFTVLSTRLSDAERYEKTLFTDEQASPELCGQKSIIYTVFGVASQVCNYVRRVSMGLDTTPVVNSDYNVPAVMSEMVEA